MSRSRLAYRHILIMLSFSDKIRLTTSISSRLALRVPNRARPFRESLPDDERGTTSSEVDEELLPFEENDLVVKINVAIPTILPYELAFELRTLNAPLCRAFLHSLTRVVRPRIKKKRLCDSTSARVLSFLRLTYGLNGKTARNIREYRCKRCALRRLFLQYLSRDRRQTNSD